MTTTTQPDILEVLAEVYGDDGTCRECADYVRFRAFVLGDWIARWAFIRNMTQHNLLVEFLRGVHARHQARLPIIPRANGGPVLRGERGPEVFTPGCSRYLVPNLQLRGTEEG